VVRNTFLHAYELGDEDFAVGLFRTKSEPARHHLESVPHEISEQMARMCDMPSVKETNGPPDDQSSSSGSDQDLYLQTSVKEPVVLVSKGVCQNMFQPSAQKHDTQRMRFPSTIATAESKSSKNHHKIHEACHAIEAGSVNNTDPTNAAAPFSRDISPVSTTSTSASSEVGGYQQTSLCSGHARNFTWNCDFSIPVATCAMAPQTTWSQTAAMGMATLVPVPVSMSMPMPMSVAVVGGSTAVSAFATCPSVAISPAAGKVEDEYHSSGSSLAACTMSRSIPAAAVEGYPQVASSVTSPSPVQNLLPTNLISLPTEMPIDFIMPSVPMVHHAAAPLHTVTQTNTSSESVVLNLAGAKAKHALRPPRVKKQPASMKQPGKILRMLSTDGDLPFGFQHRFHEETRNTGRLSEDARQFTKLKYHGLLSIITEDKVHSSGTVQYAAQFVEGDMSSADGIGFIFSSKLPSTKNIQNIVSIFVSSAGRICLRAGAEIVRSPMSLDPLQLGDWIVLSVDLHERVACFRTVAATRRSTLPPVSFAFGATLQSFNNIDLAPETPCGYFACVVKNQGVSVRLGS